MRNDDVVTMVGKGLNGATSHTLPLGSAYIVTKFKGELNKLFNQYVEKSKALAAEVGIEDAVTFDKRHKELEDKQKGSQLTEAEKKELVKMDETLKRLQGLREELLYDDVTLNIKAMPYKDWREFKEENKGIMMDGYELLEVIEHKLEDILWKAPEDE